MTSFTFYLFFIPVLAVILLAVNFIFATYNPNAEKRTAFECGFHSFLGQNRSQFSISFFIFALLFLLFDLEILLIYPYALSSNWNDIFGLLTMLLFFVLLTIGFVFELGKKALVIYSRQNIKKSDNYYLSFFGLFLLDNNILVYIDNVLTNLISYDFSTVFFYSILVFSSFAFLYFFILNKDNIFMYFVLNYNRICFMFRILLALLLLFIVVNHYIPDFSFLEFNFSRPEGPATPSDSPSGELPNDSGQNPNVGSGEGSDDENGSTQGQACPHNRIDHRDYELDYNEKCTYCGDENPTHICDDCCNAWFCADHWPPHSFSVDETVDQEAERLARQEQENEMLARQQEQWNREHLERLEASRVNSLDDNKDSSNSGNNNDSSDSGNNNS